LEIAKRKQVRAFTAFTHFIEGGPARCLAFVAAEARRSPRATGGGSSNFIFAVDGGRKGGAGWRWE